MGTIVVGCGLTLAIAIPAHAGTIKASNITLQGRESYQEGWLDPNKWDAEMDAKKSELAQILTSLGGRMRLLQLRIKDRFFMELLKRTLLRRRNS